MIAGRFILCLRDRPIGVEDLQVDLAGGRLRVEAETCIDLGRSRLRQTLCAEYDAQLRPGWCKVRATIDSRCIECDITFEPGHVMVRGSGAAGPVRREIPLSSSPLLLVDNCFATHALASLAAAAAGPSPAGHGAPTRYLAAPAGETLTVSPGRQPVLLGGVTYPPPTLTLDLLPEFQEHAWIEASWVDRLAIPQAHLRADWVPGKSDHQAEARA